MKRWTGAGIGILAMVALASCDVINPEEDIPAYIYVPDIELQTNNISEGTNSEKITDVWLSLDGGFLGAYPLPALIPLLETGNRELILQAGIKDNGINSTPEIYPFYESLTYTQTLVSNEVDTIRPVTRYQDAAKFAFIENFERSAHLFQDVRRGQLSQIQLVTEGVFEGSQSLRIRLDTSSSVVEVATNARYSELTKQSPLVYLEVNYRSDVPVVFGVIGHEANGLPSQGDIAFDPGFSPREDWNKIYFNLSRMIIDVNREEYQVVLQAFIPIENGQLTRNSAEVWLDNIKLVHF
ncbi:MAG: hypothetical protein H6573_21435 [Lewinellaceae bacterium]|nr:hypothetical protein [Phaeodactylibacter sp.]MCB0616195.1 hypothetical protein [Phaeodactylibacter sp.]MCB9350049.1 hypothetical protein [Lewinellaceae bacterium]